MYCPKCQKEAGDNAVYCPECGARTVASLQIEKKCPRCGALLEDAGAFCPECGSRISRQAEREEGDGCGKAKRGTFWKGPGRFALIAAVVIVIGAAVAVGLGKGKEAEEQETFEKERIQTEAAESTPTAAVGAEEAVSKPSEDKVVVIDPGSVEVAIPAETDFPETEESVAEPESQEPDENLPQPEEANIEAIDVEAHVERIREQYNEIVSAISSGVYTQSVTDGGAEIYSEEQQTRAAIVAKGNGNNDYSRFYYYDEGELFFAYYEGSDAHRFYFADGRLIRWRYAANAQDSQNAVNHDLESTEEYQSWEQSVLADSAAVVGG